MSATACAGRIVRFAHARYRYRPIPSSLDAAELVMRGIVVFAILFAVMGVIDAAFFKGRYLNDAQQAITGLASLALKMGR